MVCRLVEHDINVLVNHPGVEITAIRREIFFQHRHAPVRYVILKYGGVCPVSMAAYRHQVISVHE
jgi:hypothetical protein